MSRKRDLLIAPLGEAFLILIAALAGWLCRQLLIFASLGPTAYELIETPHRRSARPWSIIVGHSLAIGSGYLALTVTHAWTAPPVSASGVPLDRTLGRRGCGFSHGLQHVTAARQPACRHLDHDSHRYRAHAEAAGCCAILSAVVLMILAAEPLRRLRLRQQEGSKTAAEAQ